MKNLECILMIFGASWFSLGGLTAILMLFLTIGAVIAPAQNTDSKKPAIVLVHGAFADGSSWSKVIPLLQAKGYTVVSVANPLTSLADDVAATNRAIDLQTEPVILVGHSYAGVVITEAGNNSKVKGLVYISASAPDSGQSIKDAGAGFPPSPWEAVAIKDEGGFLWLPAATVREHFAQDLTPIEQDLIAATQVPWFNGCITDKVTHAAWHDKPSWWIIGNKDHIVSPKLQEKLAANIGAKVTKVQTGHVAMLADPKAVTDVIIAAAETVQSAKSTNEFAPNNSSGAKMNNNNAEPAIQQSSPITSFNPEKLTARDLRGPAPVVPLSSEETVKLIIDSPLADSLAKGRVVIQYRAENLRIVQVFGQAALAVSPRVGHIHVTVDDAPWHWLDASGEPLTITGLNPGHHKILIELVNANHQTLDFGVVNVEVPVRSLVQPDPKASGFRAAP